MIPSPRLPIELCQSVIDNLSIYDDEATLRACSWSCKQFLQASRYHLFYRVYLHTYRAERFLNIICSTNSSTNPCVYVRRIIIDEGRGHKFEPRWVNEALPLLAARLLNVTKLVLTFFEWSLLDGIARTAIMSSFEKVECLTTVCFNFETPEQMNQLIASFPSLTDLSCSQTYWKEDRALVISLIPLPRRLTTIPLDNSQSGFFRQLISLDQHPSVRTIKFRYMIPNEEVGKLLQTLGSSLEHVEFDLCFKGGCERFFVY